MRKRDSKGDELVKLQRLYKCAILAVISSQISVLVHAQQPESQTGIAFFESKVRPILIEHCYKCHSTGAGASEGAFQLDTRNAIRKGGDRGPSLIPGDPQGSMLLTAMSHADPDLKMPPKRDRLPDAVIADFKKWIEMGAPDPRVGDLAEGNKAWKRADRDFWAYQPLQSVTPPRVTTMR